MKAFNLEEYLKDPSREIVTRDGRNVRIVCTDANSSYPIIALVKEQYNDKEEVHTFTKNGLWKLSANRGLNDLFFAPEKHEGYVNIYKNLMTGSMYCDCNIYASKEDAKKQHSIAIAKIEWEE